MQSIHQIEDMIVFIALVKHFQILFVMCKPANIILRLFHTDNARNVDSDIWIGFGKRTVEERDGEKIILNGWKLHVNTFVSFCEISAVTYNLPDFLYEHSVVPFVAFAIKNY